MVLMTLKFANLIFNPSGHILDVLFPVMICVVFVLFPHEQMLFGSSLFLLRHSIRDNDQCKIAILSYFVTRPIRDNDRGFRIYPSCVQGNKSRYVTPKIHRECSTTTCVTRPAVSASTAAMLIVARRLQQSRPITWRTWQIKKCGWNGAELRHTTQKMSERRATPQD